MSGKEKTHISSYREDSGWAPSPSQRPLSRSSGDEQGTGESEIMKSAGDVGKRERRLLPCFVFCALFCG